MNRSNRRRTKAELRRLNDDALRRRARHLIAKGWLVEMPDHSLRLTEQGKREASVNVQHMAEHMQIRVIQTLLRVEKAEKAEKDR